MVKIFIIQLFFAFVFLTSSNANMGNCEDYVVDERLPNSITSDTILLASKVYGIDKRVIVKNGATLTVQPGTTIAGCSLFSYLVISQNSKIIAKGTLSEPIVFTSQMELLGLSTPSSPGEWGGIVVAGNAYTHYTDNRYEADETIPFGSSGHEYDNESSGVIEYVAIKHTGYEIRKDKELNGLSLAGVGKGTTIKNIAIIGGKDDGIEIWGGSVNINGLYVLNAMDDSVDVDLGYRGEISNVLVVQKEVTKKNNHDSSAMEFGNDENLIFTDESNTTLPSIKNLTAYIQGGGIYNKYDAGFRLKNVKILSEKTKENEMVYFRGKDSYTTGSKYLDGDVCLYNKKTHQELEELFSLKNSKKPIKSFTPYDYFIKENRVLGKGSFKVSKNCEGVNEKRVWKGIANSFKSSK